MNLVKKSMVECQKMIRTIEDDGQGGTKAVWNNGTTFNAVIVFNNSVEKQVAQVSDAQSLYNVVTYRNEMLPYHTVIKRKKDGKFFRITSDGEDYFAPTFSTLDMRVFTAEEFDIYD